MKYVFSLEKYKKWRVEVEKLPADTADWIIRHSGYDLLEGMDRDDLMRLGKIVLKEWCDCVEE